jgi:hypothetical protein
MVSNLLRPAGTRKINQFRDPRVKFLVGGVPSFTEG